MNVWKMKFLVKILDLYMISFKIMMKINNKIKINHIMDSNMLIIVIIITSNNNKINIHIKVKKSYKKQINMKFNNFKRNLITKILLT